MLIFFIILLFIISFLWAVWALAGEHASSSKNWRRKVKEELRHGRVIFYDSASSGAGSGPPLSSSSSSESSSRVTSGLSSSAKASSRTKG